MTGAGASVRGQCPGGLSYTVRRNGFSTVCKWYSVQCLDLNPFWVLHRTFSKWFLSKTLRNGILMVYSRYSGQPVRTVFYKTLRIWKGCAENHDKKVFLHTFLVYESCVENPETGFSVNPYLTVKRFAINHSKGYSMFGRWFLAKLFHSTQCKLRKPWHIIQAMQCLAPISSSQSSTIRPY